MKQRILPLTALLALLLCVVTSCDTKRCYCYYYPYGGGPTEENETYTSTDGSCTALSKGIEGQPGSTVCLEEADRMPVDDLAHSKK